MVLYGHGYQCDTQYVEQVRAREAKGNKPQFVFPTTACYQHNDDPYERLFQSSTSPYNTSACACGKMDGVWFEEYYRIICQMNEPIYHMGNMLCHEVEWARDIHSKPSNLVTSFVTKDCELPEIIGYEQRYDKENNVVIWAKYCAVFVEIKHFSDDNINNIARQSTPCRAHGSYIFVLA